MEKTDPPPTADTSHAKIALNATRQSCQLAVVDDRLQVSLRQSRRRGKPLTGILILELDPRNTIQIMHPQGWTDWECRRPASEPVLELFSPGQSIKLAKYRLGQTLCAIACCEGHGLRAEVVLTWSADGDRVELALRLKSIAGGRRIHLRTVRFGLGGLSLSEETRFCAPPQTYGHFGGFGRLSGLIEGGLRLDLTPIGLTLPAVYLMDASRGGGLSLLAFPSTRGAIKLRADKRVECLSYVDRHLRPGEEHSFGAIVLRQFAGQWPNEVIASREYCIQRQGYDQCAVTVPEWLPELDLAVAEICVHFGRCGTLDSAGWRELFQSIYSAGLRGLYTGPPWESDFYAGRPEGRHGSQCAMRPDAAGRLPVAEKLGGERAVREFVRMAHAAGLKIFSWATSASVSTRWPHLEKFGHWMVHYPEEQIASSWPGSDGQPELSDTDPHSPTWRAYYLQQIKNLIDWGFDGALIDGIVPRTSNSRAFPWPGITQDAIQDLIRDVAAFVESYAPGRFVMMMEDSSLWLDHLSQLPMATRLNARAYPDTQFVTPEMWHRPVWQIPEWPAMPIDHLRDQIRMMYLAKRPGARHYYMVNRNPANPREKGEVWFALLSDGIPFFNTGADLRIKQYANDFLGLMGMNPMRPLLDEVLALRNQRRELRFAPLVIEEVETGVTEVIAFLRPWTGKTLMVLINFSDQPHSVTVSLTGAARAMLPPRATLRPLVGERTALAYREGSVAPCAVPPAGCAVLEYS